MFTLTNADFVYDGSGYPLDRGSGGTSYWPARKVFRPAPEITSDVINNGAVLVYRKVYGQYWQLLPYVSGPNGFVNDSKIYNVVALATPGTLAFYYYVTGTDFVGAASAVQARPVGDSSYRYVVFSGSQFQQARAQHLDFKSLNSVQQFMNNMAR